MGYDQKGAAMIKLAKQGDNAAMRAAYLDYVNNFLTVAGFASYYGMSPQSAETYLAWWRDVHETYCAALKEPWDSGYRAGLSGFDYSDNPIEGEKGADAWAFGCSEGLKARNRLSLNELTQALRT
jgi:hypothetical protein